MKSTPQPLAGPITLKGTCMNYILITLLVIAVVVIIQQQRYRRRIVRTSTRLIGELSYENRALTVQRDAVDANYKALEEGQQELIDNYENDFLGLREQVGVAQHSAAYDRECREEAEQLLALKELIIERHASHCDSILEEAVEAMVEVLKPANG